MTYQGIVTKFLPATNFKGSRIKATAAAGSVTISADHGSSVEQRHAHAAEKLARKYKWRGTWFQGGTPDGRGYLFVCTDDAPAFAFVTPGE